MPNKRKTMAKITIHITEKEIERIKEDSETTGLSVSDIIRRIIDSFYASEDKRLDDIANS